MVGLILVSVLGLSRVRVGGRVRGRVRVRARCVFLIARATAMGTAIPRAGLWVQQYRGLGYGDSNTEGKVGRIASILC